MSPLRARVLLLLTAVLVGASVWVAAEMQRTSAADAAARLEAANRLHRAMLEQETGLRGFQLTGHEAFLAPLRRGEARFDDAAVDLKTAVDDDAAVLVDLAEAETLAGRWSAQAHGEIAATRNRGSHRPSLDAARERKEMMDDFRAAVTEIEERLAEIRAHEQTVAASVSVGLSLLLFLLFAGCGLLWWRRSDRAKAEIADRERRYRETQAEFAQTMQVVASEPEADALLKRHLERSRPGRRVTVLERVAASDRLALRSEAPDDDFADALAAAAPRDCVAIRLGRPHEEGTSGDTLLTCELCGRLGGERRCTPLLVSGQVTGAVLAVQPEPLDDEARLRMADSVTAAAPVLANLRAVALAEARAATDALTGLPNRRAIDDALARMVAQAARTGMPLAAIVLDLDRFKDVNDRFGHDRGDEVLAAVAAAVTRAVRASDFAGRLGGEELVVLAPDTGVDGGTVLAETVRAAIERVAVPGVDRAITASVGVACFPDGADTAEALLRQADQALYVAKAEGRNRVSVAPEAAAATPA